MWTHLVLPLPYTMASSATFPTANLHPIRPLGPLIYIDGWRRMKNKVRYVDGKLVLG
jgi:hypothetical protein